MKFNELPKLIDKPKRADRTPAAYAARDKFVEELQELGDTPEAVAVAMIAAWESDDRGFVVRADRYPTMAMLDVTPEQRVEMVVATIQQVLGNDRATDWRGIASGENNATDYISSELRIRHGR